MAVRRSPGATRVEPSTDPRSLRWWWVPDAAFAVLRAVVALLFIRQGMQESFGILLPEGVPWTGPLVPMSDPWILATVKLAGGGLLLLGLFTQPAAIVLGALVILEELAERGWDAQWIGSGAELVLLYVAALATFAVVGAGVFACDMLIAMRRTRRRPRSKGGTVTLSPWVLRQIRRRELSR